MPLEVPAVGTQFAMLTVTGDAPSNHGGRRVSVRCKCGVEKIVHIGKLIAGTTKSCGCRRAEVMRKAATAEDHPRKKHGGAHTALYTCWQNMKARCSNPSLKVYRWYGAKGVTVCEEWEGFAGFRDWALSSGYADDLTIDRIDSSGNYEPSNCEWVTKSENTLRMLKLKGDACKQGHPYDEANTYQPPSGHRQCRQCKRDRKKRNAKRKARRPHELPSLLERLEGSVSDSPRLHQGHAPGLA